MMIDAELRSLDHVPGWCCPAKRKAIYDLVRTLEAHSPVCVEIGVFYGQSILPAAMALRDRGAGKIVGIDPYTAEANLEGQEPCAHSDWWQNEVDYIAAESRCRSEIERRGLSPWCELRKCLPEDCAADLPSIDYLHLDDSHAKSVVLRNTRAWLPRLRPGGVLVLDDCCWTSVQPARAVIATQLELIDADLSEGRRWEIYRRC